MYDAPWSIERVLQAWKFASEHHDGQKYGGAADGQFVEYLNHIGSVTFEVMTAIRVSAPENPELAVLCAILHDTLEDTPATYTDVEEMFGKAVADGVMALTKQDTLPDKKLMMADSLARIQTQPREIGMVKLADRITNLQEPPHYWTLEKKMAYREEARLIHAALQHTHSWLADRLSQKIEDYTRFF